MIWLIKNIILVILMILICGCFEKDKINKVPGKSYPTFRIDDTIKYRIWYGEDKHQFIDVARHNCVIVNHELKCEVKDFSPILEITLLEGNRLLIEKERTTWTLHNIDDEKIMRLTVWDRRYPKYGEDY